MPSDDELRRVAEDVRALTRSLGRDLRAAIDRAREDMIGPPGGDLHARRHAARDDLKAAGRAAADELRAAQLAVRASARERRHHRDDRRRGFYGPGPGCGPRWDNWGGYPFRGRSRARPGAPRWPAPVAGSDRGHNHEEIPTRGPAAPLRHRHDGTTLIGMLAVVFGLAWLAAATNLASVSTEVVLAIALMVVGAATVITARTDWALSGRRWPVVAGAAVALLLLASSASSGLPVGFRHVQFGNNDLNPQSWEAVPPGTIHGGIGRTTINLSALGPPPPNRVLMAIDNAMGEIEVDLPPTFGVMVNAHVAGGEIVVDGTTRTSGSAKTHKEVLNPGATGQPLTLDIHAGFGSVKIFTRPPTPAGVSPVPTPTSPPTPAVPARPVAGG